MKQPVRVAVTGAAGYRVHRYRDASDPLGDPIVRGSMTAEKMTAARGAINGLMGEVIEDHIRMHLIDPALQPDSESGRAAEEDGTQRPQSSLRRRW